LNKSMDQINSYQLNIRHDAIKFLTTTSGLPSINSALEIGGGGGFTLASLKQILSIDHCTNVDISLPSTLSPDINHLEANVLSSNFKFDISSFDLLLALDIIEHIPDTSSVLSLLHSLGSTDSVYMFSLPNIQHYSLVTNVYFRNSFPKTSSGIFDSTHMRWFTLADFSKALAHNGLYVIRSSYTDHRMITTCRNSIRFMSKFFSPQFLILAKKM